MTVEINFVKKRVSFRSAKTSEKQTRILKSRINRNQKIIDFKALAKRAGTLRAYEAKAGLFGTHSPIGQAAQSIGSYVAPGNMGSVRSPIRSGIWRGLTPGKPSMPGRAIPGRRDTYRCPEGYQYGGRFTDNRLSTCGAQLFDIPSPLGAAIGLARRVIRGAVRAAEGASTPLGPGQQPESIVQSRRPQIPRVSNPNPVAKARAAQQLVSEIGKVDNPVARMVRKDGFVLEPVVPASVLRAIPDNRDMEGATYLMSVQGVPQLGGEELGLLSNTGITKLSYVLPGGSVISLEKKRQLTVGERRKLGRTVNSAAKIDVSNDPTARLKEVVNQTGDGIGYSENFINVKNPNEVVSKPGGKSMPRWVDEIFGKGRKAKPVAESARVNDSDSQIGKNISSIENAVSHIASGGALNEIDPLILGQVISRANAFKKQKLDANREMLTAPNGNRYTLYSSTGNYEHIGQRFASDIQQHLGLESPDVIFVGEGEKRKYLVEDPTQILRGYKMDRKQGFSEYSPQDVARIMVSDWLSDQRSRDPGSIIPLTNGQETRPVLTNNFTSGLTDLDKIEITERQKMSIGEFFDSASALRYRQYFQALQQQQKFAFRKEIDALLQKARQFNFTQFKARLYSDGRLNEAEKAHIEILRTILNTRIDAYARTRETLMDILGATK